MSHRVNKKKKKKNKGGFFFFLIIPYTWKPMKSLSDQWYEWRQTEWFMSSLPSRAPCRNRLGEKLIWSCMAAWTLSCTLCCSSPDIWLAAQQWLHYRAHWAPRCIPLSCTFPRNFLFQRGWVWWRCTTLGQSNFVLALTRKCWENLSLSVPLLRMCTLSRIFFPFCFLFISKNIIVTDRAFI